MTMQPFRLRLAFAGVIAALAGTSDWVSTPASGSGEHGEVFRAPKSPVHLRVSPRRPAATGELIVVLTPGTDPARFALDYGVGLKHRLRSLGNAVVVATASPAAAGRALGVL